MKKLLPFISSAIILTACGTETKTAQKTESAAENVTEQVTEQETVAVTQKYSSIDDEDICTWEANIVFFESLNEFTEFTSSEEFTEDHPMINSIQSQDGMQSYSNETEAYTPLIPIYDESKYEFTKIEYHQTGYSYYFKSLTSDDSVRLAITMETPYHTFEEMAEVANMNLVLEVENIETTVWGNTPALVQSVQFSDPVSYSIEAMIDENNRVYMSDDDMTPEELAACLSEFTFE